MTNHSQDKDMQTSLQFSHAWMAFFLTHNKSNISNISSVHAFGFYKRSKMTLS